MTKRKTTVRTPLENQATMYVPSKTGPKFIGNKPHQKRVKNVRSWFNKRYGGSTSVKSTGSWIGPKNKPVTEKVVKVTSFTNKKLDKKAKVFGQAKTWGKKWKQDSVSLEFNKKLHIISTKNKRGK